MISRNGDFETPLMLAAIAGKEDLGVMLAKTFPESIPLQNKMGLDAVGNLPTPILAFRSQYDVAHAVL